MVRPSDGYVTRIGCCPQLLPWMGHLISGNGPVHGPYLSHNHWVSLKGTKKKKKQLMLVRLSISMSKKLVADLVINNF